MRNLEESCNFFFGFEVEGKTRKKTDIGLMNRFLVMDFYQSGKGGLQRLKLL